MKDIDHSSIRRYEGRTELEEFFRYQILHPHHTPDLKQLGSLILRGFVFDTDCLTSLLMDQAPGLRTLRLIDCYCMDTHKQFLAQINEELGPYPKRGPCSELTGVEIFGLRSDAAHDETKYHPWAEEYEAKLQKRLSCE
jgi:hypothetical protein